MQRISIFIFSCILFLACKEYPKNHPNQPFTTLEQPAEPDYSDMEMWVAHPEKEDFADRTPVDSLHDNQANATADVFFIYPTMYNSLEHWVAPLDDSETNEAIATKPIKHQASIFNGSCRVFSPFYRQMTYGGFFAKDSASRHLAGNMAYNDVRKAFVYYLENENDGRPIVIAGHSQGSFHGMRLLKEFFDGTDLHQQLVGAYLPGWPIKAELYNELSLSDSATHVGALSTWCTFEKGYTPELAPHYEGAAVTNPLNWKSDGSYAAKPCSRGMVFYKYNKIFPEVCEAIPQEGGYLWITKPDIPMKIFLRMKNYHVADFNIFWLDVRKNVQDRLEAWEDSNRPEMISMDNSPGEALDDISGEKSGGPAVPREPQPTGEPQNQD